MWPYSREARSSGTKYQKLGQYYLEEGHFGRATDSYLSSSHYFERAGAGRSMAFVYGDLALAFILATRLQPAENYARKALAQIELVTSIPSFFGEPPLEKARAVAVTVLAEIDLQQGRLESALSGFALALDLYTSLTSNFGLRDSTDRSLHRLRTRLSRIRKSSKRFKCAHAGPLDC